MPKHLSPGPLMSHAVLHGGVATLSGQVALDARGGDFDTQAREVFSRIDRILAAADTGKGRLISATIWLTDVADFERFNALWIEWLDGCNPPARATVVSALALPGLAIEVQVTAAVGPQTGEA